MTAKPTDAVTDSLFRAVLSRAQASGVFGGCEQRDGRVICKAANSAAPASYRLECSGGKIWVSLVMADRWLSESIESDLVEHGDKLEELLEEELVELGHSGGTLSFEHFRSDDLLFTFRSPLPIKLGDASPAAVDLAVTCLLAYEACFRRLGDMDAGAE